MTDPGLSAAEAPFLFQYWDTESIPGDVAEMFATFRKHNPDFHHRVFSESEADLFIASHYGARERDAFRACAIPAMQADYFRYCAVLAHGGVYADADYFCVQPLWPLLESRGGGVVFLSPGEHTANGQKATRALNGFFAFREPAHPYLRLTLEIATANMEARIAERVWAVGEQVPASVWLTVGPGIFTLIRLIREWGSFDAFLENIAGSQAEPFGELFCDVIGEYDRAVEACEGVSFESFESMLTWIDHPEQLPAYKNDTNPSWHHVKTGLFR